MNREFAENLSVAAYPSTSLKREQSIWLSVNEMFSVPREHNHPHFFGTASILLCSCILLFYPHVLSLAPHFLQPCYVIALLGNKQKNDEKSRMCSHGSCAL
ncbi:hypothetical protein CHARACLAT_013418 [Characodon lateralis]|uniref:Uncharacterized protein n=1 Tax=Characodon lateralis TaxID=208331 RepID=A0ABU7CNR2_9TELE|nr:hypothetical protein [Characodon lateralis]